MSGHTTRGSGTRPDRAKSPLRESGRGRRPAASTLRRRQEAKRALADARRVRAQRNRRLWTVLTPLGAALLAAITLVAVKAASGNGGPAANVANTNVGGTNVGGTANAAVLAQVVGVPGPVFDAVGAGQPARLPQRINDPITAAGKPQVLYIGAEYCPFCAVERWPLIVALSRFGTWHGLRYTNSAAAPEVYPDTATFTFHGAQYASKWLSFTGVETHTNQRQGRGYAVLDPLSAAETAILRKHDNTGSTPFLDIGGKYVVIGATYNPTLVTGRSQAQIAETLRHPSNRTGSGIIAAANVITAAICGATAGQPANVCSSAGVAAATRMLP